MKRLDTTHCVSTSNMFSVSKQRLKILKYSPQRLKKWFGIFSKPHIMGIIFSYGLLLIVKDIILNNVTFKLPGSNAFIWGETVAGDEFIKARERGAFQDVDFLESEFTANKLMYRYKIKGINISKNIYLSKWLKDKLTENANNGIVYN